MRKKGIPAKTLGMLLCGGSAVLGKAFLNTENYRVPRRTILLGERTQPHRRPETLRTVHISDTHLLPCNTHRLSFLRSLADVNPDLVIITGDLISRAQAIKPLLHALEVFRGTAGVFVFGSNDYHAPTPKNPLRYLVMNSNEAKKSSAPKLLPTAELAAGLEDLGWINLNNKRAAIRVKQWHLELIGVDDPHIGRDSFPPVSPQTDPQTEKSRLSEAEKPNRITLGVTHAPYTRILERMYGAGCAVVFAGHTHGGQVCLPGNRALVTNCDLPASHCSGLFPYPLRSSRPLHGGGTVCGAQYPGKDTETEMFVQVSAGLGTSPYTPVRTFCPPEAPVTDLVRF